MRRKVQCQPMPPIAVVTDSTHYMPRDVTERHGLHTVSLYVRWGDPPRDDREADLPDFDRFYEYLRGARELPTTSQPSVGDFLTVYEPLVEQGADILSIHLSGGISGTVHAAEQARDQLLERGVAPERIEIVDSATACAGHGLMAIAAHNAIAGGATLADAAARARQLRESMKILFAVDTLEFLRRGGRIGGAQAWIGSTLKIKPILAIESQIVPIERVRTWGRAFERMVDHLVSLRQDGNDRFFIQHIQAPDQAEELARRGEAIYGRPPEFVSEMGPVIGAHAGPGLLGTTALRHDVLGDI
jgi:DegV family protein with EDD domain